MLNLIPPLSQFANRLNLASWFSVIGQKLTPVEYTDAQNYISGIGLKNTMISQITSWEKAESCIKAEDWDKDWWSAEDLLRKKLVTNAEQRFQKSEWLSSLTSITEQVSSVIHGAAAIAAARGNIANPGLIRSAAGSATMACYQAGLEIAANQQKNSPFIAKYRILEAGHWPLCVRNSVFYVF